MSNSKSRSSPTALPGNFAPREASPCLHGLALAAPPACEEHGRTCYDLAHFERLAHDDGRVERSEQRGAPADARYVVLPVSTFLTSPPTGGGRGLFVAQTPARVQIPAEALINLVTLRPLYPPVFAELSATCLISLHLALQHDRHTRSASPLLPVPADHFRPFLNSLPVAFPTTPLVWALQATENLATDYDVQGKDRSIAEQPISDALRNRCRQLLAAMPPSVRGKAAKVEARFRTDWTYLQSFWVSRASTDGGADVARSARSSERMWGRRWIAPASRLCNRMAQRQLALHLL